MVMYTKQYQICTLQGIGGGAIPGGFWPFSSLTPYGFSPSMIWIRNMVWYVQMTFWLYKAILISALPRPWGLGRALFSTSSKTKIAPPWWGYSGRPMQLDFKHPHGAPIWCISLKTVRGSFMTQKEEIWVHKYGIWTKY